MGAGGGPQFFVRKISEGEEREEEKEKKKTLIVDT